MATAAASGLVTIVMVQCWLDVIEGPWLLNAGVIPLAVLAIASVVAGLMALIGLVGIALGAVLMVFVGAATEGGRLDRSAAAAGRGRQPPAQHRFLRRRRRRRPARSVAGVDRAGLGAIMAGAALQRCRTPVTS